RVAGFRVLQLLPGVGPTTAAQALDRADEAAETTRGFDLFMPPQRAAADWPGFVAVFCDLRAVTGWPSDLERARLWYEPHLERMHEDATLRRNDLLQLEAIAAGYP